MNNLALRKILDENNIVTQCDATDLLDETSQFHNQVSVTVVDAENSDFTHENAIFTVAEKIKIEKLDTTLVEVLQSHFSFSLDDKLYQSDVDLLDLIDAVKTDADEIDVELFFTNCHEFTNKLIDIANKNGKKISNLQYYHVYHQPLARYKNLKDAFNHIESLDNDNAVVVAQYVN